MLVVFSSESLTVDIETSLPFTRGVLPLFSVHVKEGRGAPLAEQESMIGAGERSAKSIGLPIMVTSTAGEEDENSDSEAPLLIISNYKQVQPSAVLASLHTEPHHK